MNADPDTITSAEANPPPDLRREPPAPSAPPPSTAQDASAPVPIVAPRRPRSRRSHRPLIDTVQLAVTVTRIKDQPASERPREKLEREGPAKLDSADLPAILLRTGLRGTNAVQLGAQLLARFGSLSALAGASVQDLRSVKGIGRDKAVTLAAAFTLAKRMAEERRNEAPLLDTPEVVASLMRDDTRFRQVESFQVLLLTTRRRLIQAVKIADGTLDTLLVHAREVFKPAIAANAAAIILLHNHPSGDPTPSEADIKVTRDLIRAGQLLKIEVLDHVILGSSTATRPKDYVSLRELGYFY